MGTKQPQFLPTDPEERVLIVVFAPLIAVPCALGSIAALTLFKTTASEWRNRLADSLLGAIFSELLLSFALFALLMFIWAAFMPAWAARVLCFARDRVWHAMLFFLLGFLGLVVLVGTMQGPAGR